jgi:hypothetical protein
MQEVDRNKYEAKKKYMCIYCHMSKKSRVVGRDYYYYLIFAGDPMHFYTESNNHFCYLTSSNVLFIQLLAFCQKKSHFSL